ncbi:MAG: DUF4430 domain-containing protein [Ruminococcaceae bacterium]|nr:DUF4430 domain-containing protein [Oscillospiraceae bacterium]
MKRKLLNLICCFMVIVLSFSTSGCNRQETVTDLWEDAIYKEDAELGGGAKTVMVEVVVEDKSVTFTIHSDKATLGDALVEHNLIEGEQGAYGLYVKKVNGITADYDINRCYWGVNKNGEGLMSGVDAIELEEGEHYEFIYVKPE